MPIVLAPSFHFNQQLREDLGVTNVEELVKATMEAFDVHPQETLERVWQSLLALYGEVMGCKGDNSYNMPHLGKEKLARAGNLPENARVDDGNTSRDSVLEGFGGGD
ncbi:unnamed protein product [Discosporangium mesarthrocarpum]